jgi:transcription antitermination factor NusG
LLLLETPANLRHPFDKPDRISENWLANPSSFAENGGLCSCRRQFHPLESNLDIVHWYAIYTSANHEKKVAAQLARLGVEHFLPTYESVRQWTDRRVRLQLPLFPGYLFAHTALRDRLPILQTPGVVRLVGTGPHPQPLDAGQIESLREGLAHLVAAPYPHLPVGQRVRVTAGPLEGMEGIMLRRKSGPRVVISIELIQRSFVVDIDAEALEPIGRNPRGLSPIAP